jgi:hypothetical protein
MRTWADLDRLRLTQIEQHHDGGFFTVASPTDRQTMTIVASDGSGWDHVSVSRKTRVPNWAEMEFVKRLFFLPEETAMQLHVPVGDHISFHPHVLHLWRPNDGREIPRPPGILVGLQTEPKNYDEAVQHMRASGLL